MPRMKNETRALIDDLKSRIERIVTEAVTAGRTQALAEIRTLVGGVPTVKRGPGRPPTVKTLRRCSMKSILTVQRSPVRKCSLKSDPA